MFTNFEIHIRVSERFFSSPEPKRRLSLRRAIAIAFCPSCVVRKLFTFSSSPKCMVRFQPNFVGTILRGKRSKVAKMVHVAPRGRAPKPKGIKKTM